MRIPSSKMVWALVVIISVSSFVTLTTLAKWSKSEPASPSINQGLGVTVELLTVKATGFDPPSITIPRKSFLLVIENRSGVRELSFRFNKDVGNKLNNIRVPYRRTSWSDLVDLPPGEYQMTEVAHPEWNFTLTITP